MTDQAGEGMFYPRGTAEALGAAAAAQSKHDPSVRVTARADWSDGTFGTLVEDLWEVSGTWRLKDRRVVLTSAHFDLRADAEVPTGGLPARVLRTSLDRIVKEIRSQTRTAQLTDEAFKKMHAGQSQRPPVFADELPRAPGRPPLADEIYHRTAELFLQFQDEKPRRRGGVMNAIAHTMRDELDRDFVSLDTAKTWLRRAAEAGFITAGVPGQRNRATGPNFYTFQPRKEAP